MSAETGERVCPFCGEPPGGSAFCAACGRNLTAVERLPTRAEWARTGAGDASGASRAPGGDSQALPAPAGAAGQGTAGAAADTPAEGEPAGEVALAARCADATAAFLSHMRAAGNPGLETFSTPKPSAFKRARHLEAWVLWPVDREDFEGPRRYEPGLLLTVDGDFHRLDSELRGWGQRNFPYYEHTASLEPIEMPVSERLPAALAAVRG